ncbi:hypothetical protein JKG47_21890, partial [Acidithiobacillus sp. MC6.1]|nr:hypothetical protein [Acidithiobacillus sp. MC6.1]
MFLGLGFLSTFIVFKVPAGVAHHSHYCTDLVLDQVVVGAVVDCSPDFRIAVAPGYHSIHDAHTP